MTSFHIVTLSNLSTVRSVSPQEKHNKRGMTKRRYSTYCTDNALICVDLRWFALICKDPNNCPPSAISLVKMFERQDFHFHYSKAFIRIYYRFFDFFRNLDFSYFRISIIYSNKGLINTSENENPDVRAFLQGLCVTWRGAWKSLLWPPAPFTIVRIPGNLFCRRFDEQREGRAGAPSGRWLVMFKEVNLLKSLRLPATAGDRK